MKHIATLLLCCFATLAYSQTFPERAPEGGGPAEYEQNACLTAEDRQRITAMLADNVERLKKDGLLPAAEERMAVAFDWPLQAAAGLDYNSIHYISNYLDQDASGGVQDYFCGSRSYNGHRGIDIGTWPFPWYLVNHDLVEVVAGADGVIIGKEDGNDDNHCSCAGSWNAVYIQHADGSVAWYGHMKTNSVTPKTIGQPVFKGEYLGIVASSGCSTGPHLHLEVYDGQNNLIEPFAGPCNAMNAQTWWAQQKPYREPTLNANLTHNLAPVQGCPSNNEYTNFAYTFDAGAVAYFGNYYHDQLQGHITNCVIRRPNHTAWQSWSHTSPDTYTLSWWYWSFTLPAIGPNGIWTFETTYQGKTTIRTFEVAGALPVALSRFEARVNDREQVELTWATESEYDNDYFSVERSGTGRDFTAVGTVGGHGTTDARQDYRFTDEHPLPGVSYYRLRQVDYDGQTTFSDVAEVRISGGAQYGIFPNPASGILRVSGDLEAVGRLRLYDAVGTMVADLPPGSGEIDLAGLTPGTYLVEIVYGSGTEMYRVVCR